MERNRNGTGRSARSGFEAEYPDTETECQRKPSIRGVGHLPVITVTDKESVDGNGHSLLVTRHEKDATVKFNISSYIGEKINIRAYVKTTDNVIRMGIDGSEPFVLTEVNSEKNGWTLLEARTVLDANMNSAEFFIETDGNADYFIDDIFVTKSR